MASIDLMDANFSVTVGQQDWKLLRFSWQGQVCEFQCLPSGLSSAPQVLQRVDFPLVH